MKKTLYTILLILFLSVGIGGIGHMYKLMQQITSLNSGNANLVNISMNGGDLLSKLQGFKVKEDISVFVETINDKLIFETSDGEIYRLSSVTLNTDDYKNNLKFIEDMVVGKTVYLIETNEVDENGIKYCYVYSFKPTNKDTAGTSLNVFLIEKNVCFAKIQHSLLP